MHIKMLIILVSVYIQYVDKVMGHGRLMEPPGRSSLWRFPEFEKYNPPANWNDNELYCGGYGIQYGRNGGKCGVCGDNYADPVPRPNENGGTYGRGIITRTYKVGQIIPISVQMTATHLGYFEFNLCPQNNPTVPEEEPCFEKYTLEFADGSGTQYPIRTEGHLYVFYNSTVKLPPGLVCSQCVLRWNYHTGNSWGTCANGTSSVGCGDQETFRGCSDIAIV